jgi:transposase
MVGVQGTSDPNRELLDAAALVGHLLPAGSVYSFLADHRYRLFPDELFAELFPSGRGRPSVPADVIATVMVLQSLEGLSDREAAQALRTDLRWKVAAELALDDEGFHPTVLTLWRNKLRASDRPQRIFDAVRDVVTETGVLSGRSRRALNSTLLDDAVATQDTVTQLVSMIRRVRRAIPAAAAVGVGAHDYDQPGKPACAWDDPSARDELVTGLVNDARAILDALDGAALDDERQQLVGLLALVAGQDVEQGDEEGSWRIARKVAQGADRLHRRPRDPPHAQVPLQLPRRLQGPPRSGTRDRDHHRCRLDPSERW